MKAVLEPKINIMNHYYHNLCTEVYDITKPEAGTKEIEFYLSVLNEQEGPILEAMCGSGRLLIPLLRKGLKIEGVDISEVMLDSCAKRCEKEGLSAVLHKQSLQQLSLSKYQQIFIAVGSFQLINNREEAFESLCALRNHLLPGGRLILETFIPWDSFKANIVDAKLKNCSQQTLPIKTIQNHDGCEIIMKSVCNVDFINQVESTQMRYEKWKEGKMLAAEEEQYDVRWYHRYELELLLEKAGFKKIMIQNVELELNPQATIYIASF